MTSSQTSSQTSSPPAVALRGVSKTFGPVRAVRDLDLEIRPGEVVAFLGPNGAGKTTTIDMILGLSKPTSGSAEVLGLEPRDAVARGLVAAVMQTGGLLKDLTVAETLAYTGSLFVHTRSVDEVMETASITDIAGRKVVKCSGGEQQRLRFAMAMLSDPALLLLDEPTTGMDVEGRRRFWDAIRADSSAGRTVLFATHYLEEADQFADRIVLISRGRVVADGPGSEIKRLASGRTVRATWVDADVEALKRIGGVEQVDVRGDQVFVQAQDSDEVARFLLAHTPARDLEITTKNLEEAFIALTSDQSDTEGEAA